MLAAGRAGAGRDASARPTSTPRCAARRRRRARRDDDWEHALARWARAQLAAGDDDIHAQARERFDRALLDAALAHTGGRRSEAASGSASAATR